MWVWVLGARNLFIQIKKINLKLYPDISHYWWNSLVVWWREGWAPTCGFGFWARGLSRCAEVSGAGGGREARDSPTL